MSKSEQILNKIEQTLNKIDLAAESFVQQLASSPRTGTGNVFKGKVKVNSKANFDNFKLNNQARYSQNLLQ